MDALASQPDASANEIAAAAKVSRSTVGLLVARHEAEALTGTRTGARLRHGELDVAQVSTRV